MAKDLKHRVPAFRPKPKRVSIRWIVIIGFLAIAIILGVRSFLNPLEPAAQAEEVNVVLARGEHNQKLQFSFYKLLPDLEKELSEADITNETTHPRTLLPSTRIFHRTHSSRKAKEGA